VKGVAPPIQPLNYTQADCTKFRSDQVTIL
jgi:hypothetical protein